VNAVDRAIVQRKLATIQGAILELERVRDLTLEAYRADLWRKKAIERFLQEAIEAAVDCGAHLLVRLGRPAPPDLYSTFGALAAAGILDDALARRLAPAAGLRNRLVHEYDDLDDARIHAAIGVAVDDLTAFVAAIHATLLRPAG
jgi:uncharacterized protein YutE (UPF0331/DUF86 family)